MRRIIPAIAVLMAINGFGQITSVRRTVPQVWYNDAVETSHATLAEYDSALVKFVKTDGGRWEMHVFDLQGNDLYSLDSTGVHWFRAVDAEDSAATDSPYLHFVTRADTASGNDVTQADRNISLLATASWTGDGTVQAYRLGVLDHDSTEFVTFDGTNNRVGINKINPSYPLQVVNSVAVDGTGTDDESIAFMEDGATKWSLFRDDSKGGGLRLYGYDSGADAFFATTAGNVGIGTTSPTAKLDVNGGAITISGSPASPGSGMRYIGGGGTTNDWWLNVPSNTTSDIKFAVADVAKVTIGNNTGRLSVIGKGTTSDTYSANFCDGSSNSLLYIRDDGNVGIGTTSPSRQLDVKGTVEIEHVDSEDIIIDLVGGGDDGILRVYENNSVVSQISGNASNHTYFTGGSGKVGIGTVSPEYLLHAAKADQGIQFRLERTGSGAGVVDIGCDNDNFVIFPGGYPSGTGNVGIVDFGPDAHLEVSAGGSTGGDIFLLSSNDDLDGDILTVKENGNVGIGTTSPVYGLEIYGRTLAILQTSDEPFIVEGTSNDNDPIDIYFRRDRQANSQKLANFNFQQKDTGGSYATWAQIGAVSVDWSPIKGEIFFKTGQSGVLTEVMRLSNTGNVGIGTSNPDGPLHLHTASAGSITPNTSMDDLIIENSGDAGISILTPNSDTGYLGFGDPDDSYVAGIAYNHNTDETKFISNNDTRGIIDNAGNWGIGTDTPTSPENIDKFLHIYSDTHAGIVISDGSDDWDIFVNANAMKWSYDGSERMALYESGGLGFGSNYYQTDPGAGSMIIEGNVGIGTTSPVAFLEIQPQSADTALYIDQDQNASGLIIDSESTGEYALHVKGKYTHIEQDIADGYGLSVTRNNNDAETCPLVRIRNDHTSDTFASLELQNDGSGPHITTGATNEDLEIDPNGTGKVNVQSDLLAERYMLTSAPSADHTGHGMYTEDTVGENVSVGEVLYMKSDGKYWKADADASSTMPGVVLVMEAISADASGDLLHRGYFRDDSWDWTVGGLIYVDTTSGALTQTAPSGSGDQVQVVGYAITADIIYFAPDLTLVEVS